MPEFDVLLFRLLMVIIVGGLIGAEREYRSKSAGFRTMILICLGSFLFTTFSIAISGSDSDRIASNIVTGIGFLGAGVIFRGESRINGLTTAASVWAVAALGMGIADGYYTLVAAATIVVLIALFSFSKLEMWIENLNKLRNYKIVTAYSPSVLEQYEELLEECRLSYTRSKQTKQGNNITCTWMVQGKEAQHHKFIQIMLKDGAVTEFEF